MVCKTSVRRSGPVLIAVLLLGAVLGGRTAASERLSEAHRRILAELESRWWGWPAAPSPIVPAPKVCRSLGRRWQLSADEPVVVLLGPSPTAQEAYAGDVLRRELTGRLGLGCEIVDSADEIKTGNPIICLGTTTGNPHVARLAGLAKIDRDALAAGESYAIDFVSEETDGRRWILVAGGDPVGCIHGAFSLVQLLKSVEGTTEVELSSVRDFPTVAVRSLRGVGEALGMKLQVHTLSRYHGRNVTGDEIHDDALVLPCLDFLARNRVNCFHVLAGMENEAQLPERLAHLVDEAHRRGIRVVGGFRPVGSQQGDRSTFPCYTSETDVQKVLGFYRQFVDAGCDTLYFMADDYYQDKLAGHCPQCIARFGGLAGEQQFMLHEILELAREREFLEDRILFCPTHYDVNAVEGYLNVFNDDPKLRNVPLTFTYFTEEIIERRKQEYPHLRYALFYNGPRWLAYYARGRSATTRRALDPFARNALYFPIYFGWHAAQYDPGAGWFVNTGEDVRRTFHEVIPRETARSTLLGNIANYSDSVFKGPVEYALWGHYGWNPEKHGTKQSEAVIGDGLFGPEGGRTMGQLNRVLLDLTRLVYHEVPAPAEFRATLDDRLELARLLLEDLRDGYHAYRRTVAPDYIPPTRHFYVELGLTDVAKYVELLQSCARQRGLTGLPPIVSPPARYSGVVFPSESPDAFFIFGGAQAALGACLSDLYRYSIPDNRWERVSPSSELIPPRCGHSAVPIGGKVLFFGGTSKGWESLDNDLYVYDQQGREFALVEESTGPIPEPRFVHAACADEEGRMWIFGGLTYDHRDLGDLCCYCPQENQWQRIEDSKGDAPGTRYGSRLAYHGGSLYLFGGTRTGSGRLGDFYRFDLEDQTWRRLPGGSENAPTPRYAHSLLRAGDSLYLFGGGGNGYLNDLYRYDLAAGRWERLSPEGQIPGARGFVQPICPDGKNIYLFGGWQPADESGASVNADLYRYDVEENRFTRLHTGPKWRD
ncbi:MAG TPA: kelch repeat-containing protein [Thermoguttaceae bacterium]|nr:kelch repeat-containing protein [Thermoguttaceae bacterium]HUU83029.1 kelch repeat-containing protein [Phycisphaerae bacterium]